MYLIHVIILFSFFNYSIFNFLVSYCSACTAPGTLLGTIYQRPKDKHGVGSNYGSL